MKNAPRSVRAAIKDYAVRSYTRANLTVNIFQFGIPESQQDRMTFEKFRDEFYRQAGVLAKGTDPYLPAAYEYIENRLEALAPISIEQAEQLKPTDLRDATRVESPEIGVSEANARAIEASGEPQPIGINRFGNIYNQFKGKVKEAFDFLIRNENGYLQGVFHRDDLGDIDLAWGSAPTPYTGKGLAHIIRKHIETLGDFPNVNEAMRIIEDVINNGTAKQNSDPQLVDIEKGNYRVVVAKNAEGNWILSAFDYVEGKKEKLKKKEKGKTLPPSKTPGQSDVEAGAVTSNPPLSVDKDTKISSNSQGNLGKTSSEKEISQEEDKVDTNPSEAQKEAGNYQKGHIKVDGYDITIENPKGSVRRGTDANGQAWETEIHNTYGYIRGTEGVDGDHIDVYLSDNPASGSVFVVDQVNPSTGEFDEHKVMYGFGSEEEARQAYLSNYSPGWNGLGKITEVSREDFKKWVESSHKKTKPFADYAMVKKKGIVDDHKADGEMQSPDNQETALRDAVVDHLRSIGVEVSTDWQVGQRILDEYNGNGQVKKMGTSTRKRQNDILDSLKDRSLSEQQKQVADAFSGVSDRIILSVKSKDGKSRNIMFRQGNENRAGVKHSVFRHYNTESNGYTADEVTMIPEIIANGNRKQDQGNRVSYKYEKDGITYTVTTEAEGKNELFTNFYTNKKPSVAEQGTSNTDNRHVQPQQTDSGAKVQHNPETAKDSERNLQAMMCSCISTMLLLSLLLTEPLPALLKQEDTYLCNI